MIKIKDEVLKIIYWNNFPAKQPKSLRDKSGEENYNLPKLFFFKGKIKIKARK